MSTLESQLLMESVERLDLTNYCLVTVDTSVRETVERMRVLGRNCAFVVGKGTHLVGIFTDRDVLRKVVTRPADWDNPIESLMTPSPTTLPPDATTGEALRLMAEHRYRNVPIVDQHGTIRGNVTYYAIMKFLTDHFPQAVYNLPPDPSKFAKQPDGG